MKKTKEILKQNKFIYYLYNIVFSFLLRFLGLFIKLDNQTILFNSFGGKKYDDSPRVIYEYMQSNKKYQNFKYYWILDNPDEWDIIGAKKIKNNSFKFFVIALKSKYWVTNSGIERGLKFKKKGTIYINTWHGTPIKKIGKDENNLAIKFNVSKADIMFAQCEHEANVFSRVFDISKEKIAIVGLPRNDELNKVSKKEIDSIKKKLNIPMNKKVILYAPTFREYHRDSNGCVLAPPINLKLWEEKLSKEYILIFRAHYEVNKVLGIYENDFVKNCSNYPNLNELLKISDLLISDYSGLIIDYSILERPIINYTYDYDEYKEKRGMYFNLADNLDCIENEIELLDKILNLDYEKQVAKTIEFKKKFVQASGNARKYIDKIISGEKL